MLRILVLPGLMFLTLMLCSVIRGLVILGPGLGPGPGAVVDRHLVAGGAEMTGHGVPHDPESYERTPGHGPDFMAVTIVPGVGIEPTRPHGQPLLRGSRLPISPPGPGFDRAVPVIGAYARAVTRLGGPGAGQLTKMVNQICIAGLVQGLAEGIDFARRAGLDVDQVVDTISKGAAGSWQMENRGSTMGRREFDFGFALDWMRKDLAICLAEADRLGATLPVTAIVDQFYARLQHRGHGRWDTSSLIELLADD